MSTVRKRSWKYKGEIRTSWIVDYFDSAGVRRQQTFGRKKDADAHLVTIQGDMRKGTHTPDSVSKTVAEAGRLWIDEASRDGLEPSTIKQYREHLERHIKPFIGNTKLSRLTAPDANNFIRDLGKQGRSEAMQRKVRTSLVSLLNCARAEGWIAQNVAVAQRRKRTNGRHKKEIIVPTKGEIRTILDKAPERWRPMILTAVFTGMRASELRGLSWADVDFDKNLIRITQRADAWGTIGPPKSKAGQRTIPLAPVVINTLKEWKLQCGPSEHDLAFPTAEGNIWKYPNIRRRALIPLMESAGVVYKDGKAKYTGLHALRHFFASWCINRKEDGGIGLPPKVVQELLGHSSITMTMDVYGHLFPRGDDAKELKEAELALLGS